MQNYGWRVFNKIINFRGKNINNLIIICDRNSVIGVNIISCSNLYRFIVIEDFFSCSSKKLKSSEAMIRTRNDIKI